MKRDASCREAGGDLIKSGGERKRERKGERRREEGEGESSESRASLRLKRGGPDGGLNFPKGGAAAGLAKTWMTGSLKDAVSVSQRLTASRDLRQGRREARVSCLSRTVPGQLELSRAGSEHRGASPWLQSPDVQMKS